MRTSMSWWNAKYTNNNGEYEITFASKEYEKAKAVEMVCCAVMDKAVKSPLDVGVVVRCKDCKHRFEDSWCEYVDDDDNFYCARGERKEGAE